MRNVIICATQKTKATHRVVYSYLTFGFFVEASTGIEPVYTDLQSAASPLRQLAIRGVGVL